MYEKLQKLFWKALDFFPIKWYRNILYALDTLTNAVLLGDPRETVSSVLGKMKVNRNCKLCGIFCKVLSIVFFEPDHCIRSINRNEGMYTDNNMSVVKRRGWGNLFVILVVLVLIFRNEILDFINLIV
jgi:hypothetical protein